MGRRNGIMRPYCPITKQGHRIAGREVYRKTADAQPGWRRAMAKEMKKSARQWARRLTKRAVVEGEIL